MMNLFKIKHINAIRLSGIITGLLFLSQLIAQVDIQVIIPPPGQLYTEDIYNTVILTNTTNDAHQVFLYGTAEEATDGLIFEASTTIFDILPLEVKVITIADIEPVDIEYSSSRYEQIMKRTGSVPAGEYTICIQVISVPDESEVGEFCYDHTVLHPLPPMLILPGEEALISESYPLFTWMPPSPLPLSIDVEYEITIKEILPFQTPEEAMNSNPSWFYEKDLFSTSLLYPIGSREFENGRTYVWKVQSFTSEGMVIGENNGNSELFTFTFYSKNSSDYEKIILINPKEDSDSIAGSKPVFVWTALNIPGVNYSIFIVDSTSKLQEQSEIILSDYIDEAYFYLPEIEESSFIYPDYAPELLKDKTYTIIISAEVNGETLTMSEKLNFIISKK